MEELNWSCLKSTVERGAPPTDVRVQVINVKKISAENSAEAKYRIMLWDGETVFKNGLLITDSLPAPEKFSIIRVGTQTLPAGSRSNEVRLMMKEGRTSYAYMFHHYTLLTPGNLVNCKLQKPDPPATPRLDTSNSQEWGLGTPSSISTPPNLSTPEVPPQVRPRSSGLGVSQKTAPERRPNRDAVKRNLEASFPPPKRQNVGRASVSEDEGSGRPGSTGVLPAEPTHKIVAINPMMNRYTLKVRVSQLQGIKEVSTSRWQGKVVSCLLSDDSGDIMIKGFDRDAEALDAALSNDKTYIITGAKVAPIRDNRFNTSSHSYELSWTSQTKVTGPLLTGKVNINYKFLPLSEIKELGVDKVCDVCAWVQETGNLVEFRSRADKDLKKRVVILMDDSKGGSAITLTLWDKMAVEFCYNNRVIAIKGAKVGQWNNEKNLSIGFSGNYEVEPEIPRVEQLLTWSNTLNNTSSQLSQLNSSSGGDSEFTTIQELRDGLLNQNVRRWFKLFGWVTRIEPNIFYRAHTPATGSGCLKKVVESGTKGVYECNKCLLRNIVEAETSLKFNVRMSIADCTTTSWGSMFNAETLLKKEASELFLLFNEDRDQFEKYLLSRCLVPLVFKVSAKIETFRDAPQIKLVVHECSELDWNVKQEEDNDVSLSSWRNLVRSHIAEVHNIEAELGVAHDMEVGTTWGESIDIL